MVVRSSGARARVLIQAPGGGCLRGAEAGSMPRTCDWRKRARSSAFMTDGSLSGTNRPAARPELRRRPLGVWSWTVSPGGTHVDARVQILGRRWRRRGGGARARRLLLRRLRRWRRRRGQRVLGRGRQAEVGRREEHGAPRDAAAPPPPLRAASSKTSDERDDGVHTPHTPRARDRLVPVGAHTHSCWYDDDGAQRRAAQRARTPTAAGWSRRARRRRRLARASG